MKLYTEEQVYEALWELEHPFSDGKEIDKIVGKMSPIQVPNEDEICKKSENCVWGVLAFQLGAKWVIEQMEKQADEKD